MYSSVVEKCMQESWAQVLGNEVAATRDDESGKGFPSCLCFQANCDKCSAKRLGDGVTALSLALEN